mgnify:CR=1 FL=1
MWLINENCIEWNLIQSGLFLILIIVQKSNYYQLNEIDFIILNLYGKMFNFVFWLKHSGDNIEETVWITRFFEYSLLNISSNFLIIWYR